MSDLADIGVVGLGVMGANLALNLADRGFRVAIYDHDQTRVHGLLEGPNGQQFRGAASQTDFMQAIRPPRPAMMLVPAGVATDQAIEAILAAASPGDILIDAGNSDFHDTRRRTVEIEERGVSFLGVGVSGGAEGARHGPALMIGGSPECWERVAPQLTGIAARHHGEACAAWLGSDGAGHFVKTVHNGIEYADMQMIAEIYGLMRDGMGAKPAQVAAWFSDWVSGPLESYLIEITSEVSETIDPHSGQPILEVIADRAGQKGTGRWSVIEANRLGAVASTIEAAVAARNLSAATDLRACLGTGGTNNVDMSCSVGDLHDALLAAKIIAYAQGFDLLRSASQTYGWGLNLAVVARVWRAGCIIRSSMLDDIALAFDASPDQSLMAVSPFAEQLSDLLPALRRVVSAAVLNALPVPALVNALGYHDQLSRPRGTANLLQGLRDRFGQHGFERVDKEGSGFHGPWV